MRATAENLSEPMIWPEEGVTRIPFRQFSDPEIYEMEQERIFKGPVWHYLCLEIDLPNLGDFKTTTIGEVPIVVTRDEAGTLHAKVNRCAHKGALVCLKERGNAKDLTCAYHSWSYNLDGDLVATPHLGGMNKHESKDFDKSSSSLKEVRSYVWLDMIVVNISNNEISFEKYIKPLKDRWS